MATASEDAVAADLNVQVWKMRRIIKNLDAARGSGTSMISLFVPAKGDIARMSKMLVEEQGTAVNIKNPVNRRSVINAIASAQQRLKLYHRTPPNGLVIYCGTITTDDGKEKRISMDFEPFKPVSAALYFCGSKFQTAPLAGMLSDDSKWGFIIIDGNGSLFATLQGNTREVLQKFSVDLPKKHGRGGQSAPRFARHRVEARHNYLRKVAETAVQMFIADDKPNVSGLILAGSADFKTELGHSDLFDGRLRAIVLKIVDIAYGGPNGFNQAIELAEESLGDVKFVQEKKLIDRYFDEIAQDTGKYCYGVADTMKALEMGAVETLIVWEDLDTVRHVLKNSLTNENTVLHLKPDQQKDKTLFTDKTTGTDLEPIEATPLLEWLAQSYKNYGTTLEIVTNKSQVGMQFCRGFGGIGAMLRYRVELQDSETYEEDAEEFDLDDY